MPLSNYDEFFGGKPGAAQEAHDAMVKEYGEEKGKSVFYAKVNKLRKTRKTVDDTDVQKADPFQSQGRNHQADAGAHGRLFDNFTGNATHSHGGSYFDAGFGMQQLNEARGPLFDLFGIPRDTDLHGGKLFDEFGWKSMPAIHGQNFDTDFRAELPESDGHHGRGSWYDVFRGGRTQARFMYEGKDYEGTIVDVTRHTAFVQTHDGQVREVGLSQFLEYRTPNDEQAGPDIPASQADAPSAHSPEAHGAWHPDRDRPQVFPPDRLPPKISELPQGEHTEPRSGVPAGAMDTFNHLKSLADELDVEKQAGLASVHTGTWHTGSKIGAFCSSPGCQKAQPKGTRSQKFEVRSGDHPLHSVPCANCGGNVMYTHVGGSRPGDGDPVRKSVDATETAAQGTPTGKTVSHRSNCPRGGSAPCGADVNGKCTLCGYKVQDHEAVGKAFGSPADALAGGQTTTVNPDRTPGGDGQARTAPASVEVPHRSHKATDHHSTRGRARNRCPHCGGILEFNDHQTEQGHPDRQEKQGGGATFDSVTSHKCVGTALDVLKELVA